MTTSKASLRPMQDVRDLIPQYPGTSDELRAETEEAVSKAVEKPAEPKLDDPRLQREYTFPFRFVDGAGRVYEGTFTNKILGRGEKQGVAVLNARFSNGLPQESFAVHDRMLNRAMAHMTFSLIQRPKWADNLLDLDDDDLVFALYEEVAQHEERFRGRPSPAGAGEA